MNDFDIQKALDALKIQEDFERIDRKSKNIDGFLDIIKSGIGSPREITTVLESLNISLKDYIYLLEYALRYRNINFYDVVLELASGKYPDNIHLLFYKGIFGSNANNISHKDLDKLINSNFYKYMEFAFSRKMKLVKISHSFLEIKQVLQQLHQSKLPTGYKQPILDLFARITVTGNKVRPNDYEELVLGLINVFRSNIILDDHPWYFRMYLRLHMYIIRFYDNDMYYNAYNQIHHKSLDYPTALYNMLHLYNYSKINRVGISFTFLDGDTRLLLDRHPSTLAINKLSKSNPKQSIPKKIALIISGQIRGLKKGQIRILNRLGLDVDIFISTWKKKSFKIPYNLEPEPYYRIFSKNLADILHRKNLLGNVLYSRYPSVKTALQSNMDVDFDILKNHQWCNFLDSSTTFNLRNVEIFDENDEILNVTFSKFNIKRYNNSVLDNQSKMFYMNYCGYLSMKNYEVKTQEEYAYILKVRPDINVEINIDGLINEINDVQAISADVMRPYDCGDRVAFGPSLIMSQYMRMFEVLHIYQNDPKSMFGCGVFKVHAPLDYQVVSSGGQIYRSSYVQIDQHLDLDVFSDKDVLQLMFDDAKHRGFDDIDYALFEAAGFQGE